MNQKVIVVLLAAVVAVVLAGGGYFLYAKNHIAQQQQLAQPTQSEDQSGNIPTLAPSDIGLSLRQSDSGKFAGHGLIMTVSKLDGIATIDCEFSYIAQGSLPRGGICKSVSIKPSDTIVQQEYPYGTCSDVCHFDSEVSNVKIILKVTKSDGKTYQVTQSL